HVLPLREIPVLGTALVDEEAGGDAGPDAPVLHAKEPDLEEPPNPIHPDDRPGRPSVFTCPACYGTVCATAENGLAHFRCRVGHVYSPESMLAAQTDSVDRALWVALRSLEERAALTHRLADRARRRNHTWVSKAFQERALAADEHAAVLRDLLTNRM